MNDLNSVLVEGVMRAAHLVEVKRNGGAMVVPVRLAEKLAEKRQLAAGDAVRLIGHLEQSPDGVSVHMYIEHAEWRPAC